MSESSSYAPKYVQIIETLRRRIADGTYPVDEPLPSESKLIREFGASRPTVVRALNEMQLLGEVERLHGRGTFVKAAPSSPAGEHSRPGLAVLDRQETATSVKVVEVGRTPRRTRWLACWGSRTRLPRIFAGTSGSMTRWPVSWCRCGLRWMSRGRRAWIMTGR